MPNTLLEGMSSGLPIACSDRGPMPEILKDAGVYFNPENIDSIVETIEYLINNQQMRKQLGNAAKLYSENYSWSKCGSETIKYLIEILNKETLRS
jgi:glycosyltransferase involved in cell wall biosynthesis